MSKNNLTVKLRKVLLALVLTVGILFTQVAYGGQVLAADAYNSATDGYMETRNPNRVNSTTEEISKSKLNLPDDNQGESIYDRAVDKSNKQQTDGSKREAKAKSLR